MLRNPSPEFEAQVVAQLGPMRRYARALTGDAAWADDLVQDAAERALSRWTSFRPQSNLRAWLLTILRHTHINRNRRRRPELLRDPETEMDRVAVVAGSERTDAVVDATFDAEVQAALVELAAPFRQAVELVDVGGLSYGEAAEALGVPVGTVMSRLHRGRARIRDRLALAGVAPRSPS